MRARLMVLGTAVLLAAGACSAGPVALEESRLDAPVTFRGVADTPVPGGVADASRALAAELVGSTDGDVVVSPLSLQLALATLREGASGEVAQRLDAVVGLPADAGGQTVADLRARLAAFEGDVSTVERDEPPERPLVHLADGVFVQEDAAVEAEFLERAGSFHAAQVYSADFTSGAAKALLDAWVERETGGLLTAAPAEPPPDTVLTLLNAVTFAASWRSPFAPEGTWERPFTRADGTVVDVPTMGQMLDTAYAEGDGWRAVELAYSEGFAMRLVLPDAGPSVTPEQWRAVHEALDAAPVLTVTLMMPQWEADTTLDLVPVLRGLGLDPLFTAGGLDGLFPGAFVSGVAQAATITVAERGTVAAAVTQADTAGSAPPEPTVELHLDRPFQYQVVEQATGLVLFAGRVADPS